MLELVHDRLPRGKTTVEAGVVPPTATRTVAEPDLTCTTPDRLADTWRIKPPAVAGTASCGIAHFPALVPDVASGILALTSTKPPGKLSLGTAV